MSLPVVTPRSVSAPGSGAEAAAIAALRSLLGPKRVLVSPFEKMLYAKDASAIEPSEPGIVVLPLNADEVQRCVGIANEHGLAITPARVGDRPGWWSGTDRSPAGHRDIEDERGDRR